MATKKKSPNVGSPLTQAKRAVSSRPAKVASQVRDAAKQARTAQAKPAATKQTKIKTPKDLKSYEWGLANPRKYPNRAEYEMAERKADRVSEDPGSLWNPKHKNFEGRYTPEDGASFEGSPLNASGVGIPMKGETAPGGREYRTTDGHRTHIHKTNPLAESSGVNHKIRRNQKKDERKLYETSVARGLNTNDAFTKSGKRIEYAGKGSVYSNDKAFDFEIENGGKAPYKDRKGLAEEEHRMQMHPEQFYGSTPNAVKPKKTTKKKK